MIYKKRFTLILTIWSCKIGAYSLICYRRNKISFEFIFFRSDSLFLRQVLHNYSCITNIGAYDFTNGHSIFNSVKCKFVIRTKILEIDHLNLEEEYATQEMGIGNEIESPDRFLLEGV